MKKIFFVFILFTFLSFGYGYLEYKYWCNITKDKIIISLTKEGENFVKCIDYVKNIDIKLQKIDKNISLAKKYLNSKYSSDWRKILDDNLNRKKVLEKFRDDLISKMKLFENKLFLKIKGLINKKFFKYRKKLVNKRKLLLNQYYIFLAKGDKQKLINILSELENIQKKIILIDIILKSSDFSQLIPSLKLFFNIK